MRVNIGFTPLVCVIEAERKGSSRESFYYLSVHLFINVLSLGFMLVEKKALQCPTLKPCVQDEVLAVSRKMVVRVEDLVRWSCPQPADWSRGQKGALCGTNGLHRPLQSSEENCKSSEPLKVKIESKKKKCLLSQVITTRWSTPTSSSTAVSWLTFPHIDQLNLFFCESFSFRLTWLSVSSGPLLEAQGIRVLSYPQYCRYRSLQRRIQEGARSPAIQDRHMLALGGVKAPPTTRMMYCRDTFSHPTLECSSNFSWQFSECFTLHTGEGFDISIFFSFECLVFFGLHLHLVSLSRRMSVSQSQRTTSEEERTRWKRLSDLQPIRDLDRQDEGQFTGKTNKGRPI